MSVYDTDKAVYTPNDFVIWTQNSLLEITPKFQRRPVWRTPARSFFLDTILRGMTIPPIYLRITQSTQTQKIVRQVVDGQQRVRSVLDYMNDGFRLSKTLNAPWAGKLFSQLTPNEQQQITQFSFTAEIFKGISDQQILEVFCRLNMNGVALNKQELRNGKYFGLFKQASYSIAYDYLEFWRNNKIFSEQSIARMSEVELTSELLIAANSGMQDKKTSIDNYYLDFEDSYPNQKRDERRFRDTMEAISESFGGDLADTQFRRPPLFYSLYCTIFHHMFGLPGVQQTSPKQKLSQDNRQSLKAAVITLSEIIDQSKTADATLTKKQAEFVSACQRQTDNIAPRRTRFDTLYKEAF